MGQKKSDKFVEFCLSLVQEPNVEIAVKVGDILSLIVSFCYSNGEMKKA